jgi:hypothetical protein
MTWLDLYNYLNKQANLTQNIGEFNWQDQVIVYDTWNMKEYNCDGLNWIAEQTNNKDRYCLIINTSLEQP